MNHCSRRFAQVCIASAIFASAIALTRFRGVLVPTTAGGWVTKKTLAKHRFQLSLNHDLGQRIEAVREVTLEDGNLAWASGGMIKIIHGRSLYLDGAPLLRSGDMLEQLFPTIGVPHCLVGTNNGLNAIYFIQDSRRGRVLLVKTIGQWSKLRVTTISLREPGMLGDMKCVEDL